MMTDDRKPREDAYRELLRRLPHWVELADGRAAERLAEAEADIFDPTFYRLHKPEVSGEGLEAVAWTWDADPIVGTDGQVYGVFLPEGVHAFRDGVEISPVEFARACTELYGYIPSA
jgi:hypothetical protein